MLKGNTDVLLDINFKALSYLCDSLVVVIVELVAQSCPTLCNLLDCSLAGTSVHEILQARILEWVTIPFFRRSS